MKELVIVGNGGFAREIEWLVGRMNQAAAVYRFLGFIDHGHEDGTIGDDRFLMQYSRELCVVIAIGNASVRHRLGELYKRNRYLSFPNIIDPSAIVSERAELGHGNIICAGTVLTVGIKAGDFNIMNLGCTIGHDVVVEDYVTLNPGCNISGNVHIESFADIGTGTQIVQGKRVGCNAIIGAGAVVSKSIPGNCTAVGVPARPIKYHGEI